MRMKITMIFFLLLVAFSNSSSTFAAPSISSVTGTVSDGSSITISGSAFGANIAVGTNDFQWLGDNIKNGTVGNSFSASDWSARVQDATTTAGTFYDNAQAHSGSQSLIVDFSPSSRYKGYFTYNSSVNMTKVYFTWWLRVHWDGVYWGRWKFFRIQRGSSPVDREMQPGFFMASSNVGNIAHNEPNTNTSEWLCNQPCNVNFRGYLNSEDMPGADAARRDKWLRVEMYIEESGVGKKDGTFQYWLHEPNAAIRNPIYYDNNLLVNGTSDHLKHIIFGHYAGDGMSSLTTWWDDVFVQVGTQARVEIGDASTWGACTWREIQVPTAWSNSSVNLTVNQGSFNVGDTAYAYVVDSAGSVSTGYPISFGGSGGGTPPGGGDTTPPSSPTGLTVHP